LVLAGVGVGSILFSIVSTAIVNPTNEAPYLPSPDAKELVFPKHVAERVPKMLH